MNIKYFFLIISSISAITQAQAAGSLLRDGNGNILYVSSQYEASGVNPNTLKQEKPDVCKAAGKGHLPTIRELAEEARAMGALGILEKYEVDYDNLRGYIRIYGENPDGQHDEFYFNSRGFQSQYSDPEKHVFSFWSSTTIFGDQAWFLDVSDSSDRGHLGYTHRDAVPYWNGNYWPNNHPGYPIFCIADKK